MSGIVIVTFTGSQTNAVLSRKSGGSVRLFQDENIVLYSTFFVSRW